MMLRLNWKQNTKPTKESFSTEIEVTTPAVVIDRNFHTPEAIASGNIPDRVQSPDK
jgi:hypothetical protein